MNILRQLGDGFSSWMDCVAANVVALLDWVVAPRKVQLTEQEGGKFEIQGSPKGSSPSPVTIQDGVASCSEDVVTMLKGSRVELVMRTDRFFFRALELPQRAAEFLDGIVRAQIDRITPWNASEAVFGWSAPSDAGNDRISVTIAAAAQSQVIPIAQAVGQLGVKSTTVSTRLPNEADKASIKVFEQLAAGALEIRQVHRILVIGFLALVALSVLVITSDIIIGSDLQNRQIDIARRIAERRGIIRAGSDAVANSVLAKLARRKSETPATVIVLEALSNVLPDQTYVTELRIEGDKVQIIGISKDTLSLIRLIEDSPHFSRATFFAPTTRSPSDPGDRFHIEARIKPVFSPPS